MMNNRDPVMNQVDDYAKAHLQELALEIIEFQDTGLLRQGRLRILADIARPLCGDDSLKVVTAAVQRAALELIAMRNMEPA
ncbi:hypothetical protein [Achromobacter sp. DH1f]|uniref:hypothetical protein n=1 Tax=Achromobacter sp. DH1f TaxID=1397275 RepID=UPI00046A17FC|nr:hypothetical protein [Achromobacter sp. DH1f]